MQFIVSLYTISHLTYLSSHNKVEALYLEHQKIFLYLVVCFRERCSSVK